MKRFFAFIKKEFYHIIRDRRTLLILFGMPIAQIILFGYAITNEIKYAKVAILDQSKDQVTQDITQRILSNSYFQLDSYLSSASQIEPTFKKGTVKMVIVFGPDFYQNYAEGKNPQIQLLADATDPNTATTIVSYASSIINNYMTSKITGGGIPYTIDVVSHMQYNPELKSVYMFIPGVMTIILMLVSAMMTSVAITREKELGTMEVLMVSPLSPVMIVAGKVVPYLVLAGLNAALILTLGHVVFGMPMNGSIFLLAFICFLFVLAVLSLGVLISTIAPTQQTAMMVSLSGLMLPTIMLSGYIFPVESMPKVLQVISNALPARWFIIIIKDVMIKGVGIKLMFKEIGVLLLMTLIFLGISIRNYKTRLS